METINVILDSESEHRQCRLIGDYIEWEKTRLPNLYIKLNHLFPNYVLKYKTLVDIEEITNWVYPIEVPYIKQVTNIKNFINIIPSRVVNNKGIILFILRENLLDSDVYKIQISILKNKDIAKRIVFLSVHKDNNHNFKHYNVAPHHFHNFSVDQRNTTELDNNTCDFIDNYNKRHFCCFLQHYADNPERKYLLSFLEKHKLLDKGFVSLKNYGKDFSTTGKGGYSFTSYNSVFNDLDIATTINNSYINIIPEGNFTHRESQFVTEKPLRSFLYKRPFIIMNRQYDLKYIRSMGYRTFSPIIDESYDNIYSHSSRLTAICTEIKRLMNKPLEEFIQDMNSLKGICEYNYKIYMNNRSTLEKYLYKTITRKT